MQMTLEDDNNNNNKRVKSRESKYPNHPKHTHNPSNHNRTQNQRQEKKNPAQPLALHLVCTSTPSSPLSLSPSLLATTHTFRYRGSNPTFNPVLSGIFSLFNLEKQFVRLYTHTHTFLSVCFKNAPKTRLGEVAPTLSLLVLFPSLSCFLSNQSINQSIKKYKSSTTTWRVSLPKKREENQYQNPKPQKPEPLQVTVTCACAKRREYDVVASERASEHWR
jgi:hypothetical protein